jgi:Mn2+/Fe2+ NRAMP family transporter
MDEPGTVRAWRVAQYYTLYIPLAILAPVAMNAQSVTTATRWLLAALGYFALHAMALYYYEADRQTYRRVRERMVYAVPGLIVLMGFISAPREGLEFSHEAIGVLAQVVPVLFLALVVEQRMMRLPNYAVSLPGIAGLFAVVGALVAAEAGLVGSLATGVGNPARTTVIALAAGSIMFLLQAVLPPDPFKFERPDLGALPLNTDPASPVGGAAQGAQSVQTDSPSSTTKSSRKRRARRRNGKK